MKAIINDNDYQKALIRIEKLIDIDPDLGTDLSNELELLCKLVEAYEDIHYPIEYKE
jgi:HTH-type transcriptional regulator/antitoxin HigA